MNKKYPTITKNNIESLILKDNNDCWNWQFGIRDNKIGKNYGRIWIKKIAYPAHRHVYELFFGEIDKSLYICHHCDNPLCVNPKHLFIGTPKDNMKDKISKNRGKNPGGTKHYKSKLSINDIKFIIKNYKPRDKKFGTRGLGRKFNVTNATIVNVLKNRTYKGEINEH